MREGQRRERGWDIKKEIEKRKEREKEKHKQKRKESEWKKGEVIEEDNQ